MAYVVKNKYPTTPLARQNVNQFRINPSNLSHYYPICLSSLYLPTVELPISTSTPPPNSHSNFLIRQSPFPYQTKPPSLLHLSDLRTTWPHIPYARPHFFLVSYLCGIPKLWFCLTIQIHQPDDIIARLYPSLLREAHVLLYPSRSSKYLLQVPRP